jgi:hypothetical protein
MAKNRTAISVEQQQTRDETGYPEWLTRFQNGPLIHAPLFTTSADPEKLWEDYLSNLPPEHRQRHTCNACRHFIQRFGGLVYIDSQGMLLPFAWAQTAAPTIYGYSVLAMFARVARSAVTGPFYTNRETLGTPHNGPWIHFAMRTPENALWKSAIRTPFEQRAEKIHSFNLLQEALSKVTSKRLGEAITLLRSNNLNRSEKVLGHAEWLLTQKELVDLEKGKTQRNLLWLAVVNAPTGFCHVNSSMLGTLLKDLADSSMDLSNIVERFNKKMYPLQYQRPQAAPTKGNIARAEKIVDDLGLKPALDRRMARLEEVPVLWLPRKPAQPSMHTGVFGHLLAGEEPPRSFAELPSTTYTFQKFLREVLPKAEQIQVFAHERGTFGGITTAMNPDAPPLFQWDQESQRNPFAWYTYTQPVPTRAFDLTPGWIPCTAITHKPWMWTGDTAPVKNQSAGIFFLLKNARDRNVSGLALFPESLRSELREVRSTIEAFSKQGTLQGLEEGSAVGLLFDTGINSWNLSLQVTTSQGTSVIKIDRWD